MDANGTFYLLTDALGSILSDISWSAGGASIKASQVFGPYGNARGTQGTINTAKGFTGQYNDPLTGLDYYVSRYYDPVVGVFLSADKKQGNLQGMDPYTYVGGNPESRNDPSGQYIVGENGEQYHPGAPFYSDQGQEFSIQNGQPYNGPGFQNGWRLGQGPNVGPQRAKPTKPKCSLVCGGVKDEGLLAQGIKDMLLGGALTAAAIASLENDGWLAGLGTAFFLSWLGQGVSDILFGAREFLKAFHQVSAGVLFALDLAKMVVDVATAVINTANIINIIRSPGPGLGFLGKLGWIGKTVVSLFTGEAAPTATLMFKVSVLISSTYQLASPQQGAGNTLSSDWSNLESDFNAYQQELD